MQEWSRNKIRCRIDWKRINKKWRAFRKRDGIVHVAASMWHRPCGIVRAAPFVYLALAWDKLGVIARGNLGR